MPWEYNNFSYWNHVSKYLVGRWFWGSLKEVTDTPDVRIVLDAKVHHFREFYLEEGGAYECIVLNKIENGLILDIGLSNFWENGSLVGLAHKSSFSSNDKFLNAKPGEKIITHFLGFSANKKPILGDDVNSVDVIKGKYEHLLNTTVTVLVRKDSRNKNIYFINDEIPVRLPITKQHYPENKLLVKDIVQNLKDGQQIECEVVLVKSKSGVIKVKIIDGKLFESWQST